MPDGCNRSRYTETCAASEQTQVSEYRDLWHPVPVRFPTAQQLQSVGWNFAEGAVFGTSDHRWEGASGTTLLGEVLRRLDEAGYTIEIDPSAVDLD